MAPPETPSPIAPTLIDAPLAAYLLAEPFVGGKTVVDIGPRPARASERLVRAGAASVTPVDGAGARLEIEDRSADVVLCVARMAAPSTDAERHRWLAELRRVLRPGGFLMVRMPAAAFGASGMRARGAFEQLLRGYFAIVDIVGEAPLACVSYIVPDTDEAAVNEELATIAPEPTHFVALCTDGAQRPWHLPESLLVPLKGAGAEVALSPPEDLAALRDEVEGLVVRCEAASLERDTLRESVMTLQDQAEQQEQAVSALRREAERHLRQLSEDAAALELATLERDRLEKRATSAERALESLGTQLQQRTAELVALERELARARAAAGPGDKTRAAR